MQVDVLLKELQFRTARSSGPGGQHVNKVSSKVEVLFHVWDSEALTEKEKELLKERLSHRISEKGFLIVKDESNRSQHRNKAFAIDKLVELLREHLKVRTPRKRTKIPKSVIEKRLKAKHQKALKKQNRKPPKWD
ncbi:alternative ribosome rescue aminoacyl-tRNA hydrolase ArfB [Aureisphaera galaxeae]|uniref:alternative ribosome rescue aminoacyl-tRNA hydrolase ArfB n=1 Tax=Aureisphaera galaxeae TaxID=1538023 RepID=UPI002350857F|nr:alternative ribosome rescue aminoacyl-tRNA hydrolase ArfB [Aureisphaera galaxeae]MDC8002750.1 alternative ribosome rescue aminoacyl-tRNA hydrolase ArfB [Aureisphaera galaxeae]